MDNKKGQICKDQSYCTVKILHIGGVNFCIFLQFSVASRQLTGVALEDREEPVNICMDRLLLAMQSRGSRESMNVFISHILLIV
jgi:hypothetical protein